MSKLTLSVDSDVVSRAKRYAKKNGTSVSAIVENYLALVADPPNRAASDTPVLNSLRGILKRGDVEDYRKHLLAKYR